MFDTRPQASQLARHANLDYRGPLVLRFTVNPFPKVWEWESYIVASCGVCGRIVEAIGVVEEENAGPSAGCLG